MATSGLNLDEFGSAVSNAEGYGIPGAIPTIANNPGDLELGDIGYGTTNGVTNFATPQDGADALTNEEQLIASGQSANYSSGESLTQAGETYSGGDPNWATNVASYLGVSPSSTLGSILSQFGTLTSGMLATEGAAGLPTSASKSLTANASGQGTISGSVQNIVFVVLGIVLIAVGAISFKGTQTVIENVSSGAAKAAEIAA